MTQTVSTQTQENELNASGLYSFDGFFRSFRDYFAIVHREAFMEFRNGHCYFQNASKKNQNS